MRYYIEELMIEKDLGVVLRNSQYIILIQMNMTH